VITGFGWVAFRGECEAAFLPMCFACECLLSATNVGARCVDFVVAYVCVRRGGFGGSWVLGQTFLLKVIKAFLIVFNLCYSCSLCFVLVLVLEKVKQRNERCRHTGPKVIHPKITLFFGLWAIRGIFAELENW
jgi:hypothetical protein